MPEDIARDLIAIYSYNNTLNNHFIVVQHCKSIMNEEINLKRKLVEATNAVRKKFKQIKAAKVQSEHDLEKFYEPVSKPLTSISDVVTKNATKKTPVTTKPQTSSSGSSSGSSSRTSSPTPSISKKSQDPSIPMVTSTPIAEKTQTYTPIRFNQQTLFETPSPSNQSTITSHISSGDPSPYAFSSSASIQTYLDGLYDRPTEYDTIYGVRFGTTPGNKSKTFIGIAEVRFQNEKVTLYRRARNVATFKGSKQLYDLLFLKNPNILNRANEIDEDVQQIYKDILEISDAAYKYYDKKMGLRESRGKKYLKIIKPLLMGTKLGEGLSRKKKLKKFRLPNEKYLSDKPSEYIYWNKPKELVDRLRLLWSSKVAGHTGHDNEIMSIIEELREEGIIY